MNIFKISILLFFISSFSFGQKKEATTDLNEKIPIDSSVKIGKLENGLTYYVRHNPKSKNKAELRLVINAGSILETDEQQGLAHFLEHMAFNGTANFEKNELINFLQNLGVEFGADLNAHTSFDETVYKLTLPTENEEIYNQGLQILRDWADGIILSDVDIDEERGVVAEELRSGLVGSRRLFNQYVPLITNEARYAKRLPIGQLDVILNADYEQIRDFYKNWYRPDLMAVIVVGDINIEGTIKKIEETFKNMKSPEDPRTRVKYSIPDITETKAGVFTDEEVVDLNFYAYYKKDKKTFKTLGDYREKLLQKLYSGMLNLRLKELVESGDAPFLKAGVGIGTFLADKSAYYISASLKETNVEDGITTVIRESERARRFGFTPQELERYKSSILNSANVRRKEEGKINSKTYVEGYIDHFINQDPIPASEFSYKFYKEQLPGISLEEVNNIAEKWIRDENITLVLAGPEKEDLKLPNEEGLKKLLNSVKNMKLDPYVDDLNVTKIMQEKPAAGKYIDSKYIESVGVTELKLSNGITVILKPTSLQNDIINLSAFRSGGSSLAPDSNYISARNAGEIISESGINNISSSALRKLNMGKTVSVRPYINFYDELIRGTSSTDELETMLQMTHLYFTNPNKDENIFKAFKARQIASVKNEDASPFGYFYKRIAIEMTDNHLRAIPITMEQIENELDLDKAYEFYKNRFSNADGFTFLFVGNFDIEGIKPLLETYLGSLPAFKSEHSSKDIGLRYTQGNNKTYYRGKEEKGDVQLRFNGKTDFSIKEQKIINALASLVKLKLYEELREKMGEVYGIRVAGYITDVPYEWYRLSVEFSCSPENVDELIKAVHAEIETIKTRGVEEADLTKIKEAIRLNAKEGLDYNSYWVSKLKESYEFNLDPANILDYNSFADELTGEDLQNAAIKFLKKDAYSQFILLPEKL